jgi:hypothetical protein
VRPGAGSAPLNPPEQPKRGQRECFFRERVRQQAVGPLLTNRPGKLLGWNESHIQGFGLVLQAFLRCWRREANASGRIE